MNAPAAKRVVLASLAGTALVAVAARAGAGELPNPRIVIGAGVVYVVLGGLADTAPDVAGPLAGLVFAGVLLANGKDASAAILQANKGAKLAASGPSVVPGIGSVGGVLPVNPFQDGGSDAPGSPTTPAAPVSSAGGARGIVENAYAIARQAGGNSIYIMSAHRPGAITTSGNTSDHSQNDQYRAARDIARQGASRPTPELDRAAVAIGRAFGRSYPAHGSPIVDTFTWNGWRVQVLYRTLVGGNHYNHVHVGCRKA